MGLNFYGRDFSTEDIKDILGRDYTAALARERAMKHWDDRYQEETLTFKDGKVMHVVFYPTVKSIQVSMQEHSDRYNVEFIYIHASGLSSDHSYRLQGVQHAQLYLKTSASQCKNPLMMCILLPPFHILKVKGSHQTLWTVVCTACDLCWVCRCVWTWRRSMGLAYRFGS